MPRQTWVVIGHVGGLGFERRVDDLGVDAGQLVGVLAAGARLRQLLLGAQVGPHRVVELQIAAAGVVERLDGLAVELGEVVEVGVHVRVGLLADGLAAAAEVHHRRRGDGHLRHELGVGGQELEVREHGMVGGEVQLAGHLQALGLGLDAVELDAVVEHDALAAGQVPEEIEVPPGAAELAVGGELQAHLLLLLEDLPDLLVLDLLQLVGVDRAPSRAWRGPP